MILMLWSRDVDGEKISKWAPRIERYKIPGNSPVRIILNSDRKYEFRGDVRFGSEKKSGSSIVFLCMFFASIVSDINDRKTR